MKWLALAWANRVKLYAGARALRWPWRVWAFLAVLAAMVGLGYWGFVNGYLRFTVPAQWTAAQWVDVALNVLGFGLLYLAFRGWGTRQDEVWDAIEDMQAELDELRGVAHDHEEPAQEDEEPPADTIVGLSSARPAPPAPAPQGPPTEVFQAVRAEPVPPEPPTVQRTLGGRTFSFRAPTDESVVRNEVAPGPKETSEVG